MDTLFQDLRYAVRKLFRTPGFTAVTTLTLGLAIGANTAIFSIVNGVLLKPLPFAEPERLVRVTTTSRSTGGPFPTSGPDFLDYRAQSRTVPAMAAMDIGPMNLTGSGGEPERLRRARVSASFFSVLGVRPALGRGFLPSEDSTGAPRVVVLSHAFWQRHFAGDGRVLGQTVTLDGAPYTVVGVAPRGFTYPERPDVWAPMVWAPFEVDPENRGAHWLNAIGRLAPGVTPEQATRELGAIARRLEQQFPSSNTNFGAGVIPLREQMVGDVRRGLLTLLGAVGFVLLIACANVANLLLVRAASRETEMAVRAALGAARSRIARQLVTESVILALLGGAVGALLAAWGVDLLIKLGPGDLPRLDEVRVDGRVLAFTAGLAVLTGLLFGLAPALHAARGALGDMLKGSGRGSSMSRGSRRVRSALVVSEMALAVVLLVGAGLLIRSFARLMEVDPGFRAERVVTFNVSLPGSKYDKMEKQRRFVADLSERMRTLPGAQASAMVLGLPMSDITIRTSAHIVGTPEEAPGQRKLTDVAIATPGYFATLGIPVVRGRPFVAGDRRGAPQVAVVNREFARRYFGSETPLGKRLELGMTFGDSTDEGEVRLGGEVVGIVGDVRRSALSEDIFPEVYVPFEQAPVGDVSVIVRTTADAALVGGAARAQVRAIDPDLPIYGLRTLEDLVADSVSRPRFYMLLLGIFAGIALTLAAVGIYGVISYAVSQRTRELGIRIALGATRDQVVRLVLGQGLGMTMLGVALGIAAALWVTRLIASMLFGVSAADPLTIAGVSLVLTGVAALACYVPARRAAKVDPVIAMRAD